MSRSIERSRRFENIHNLINNISKILFHVISSNKRTKISSDMGQLVVPDGRTDRRTEWPVGDSSLTKPFISNTLYDSPFGTPYTSPKMHLTTRLNHFGRPTTTFTDACHLPGHFRRHRRRGRFHSAPRGTHARNGRPGYS